MFCSESMERYGDVRPLDEHITLKLYTNTLLAQNTIFEIDQVLDELVVAGCILDRHKQYVRVEELEFNKNRRLIEVMTRRSVADYKTFVSCINTRQPPLYRLLTIDDNGQLGSTSL